ncbi:MAG: Fur family transcriptional regulator [Candidatus Cloacimonetes bacterium]|nr:Fur family transcriptional regulator [Candidatus Cloacimonadota bacterium]
MEDQELKLKEFLKIRKMKLTVPRKIILDAVFQTHEHFDVESIYNQIKDKHKNVSLATVYRTIPLLTEAGLVKPALRSNSKDLYEHIYGHPQHLHFICNECNSVYEESIDKIEKQIVAMAESRGFTISDINIKVKGLCQDCNKKE